MALKANGEIERRGSAGKLAWSVSTPATDSGVSNRSGLLKRWSFKGVPHYRARAEW